MPNWCENRLEVKGPREKVQEFDEKFKGRGTHWGVEPYMLTGLSEEEKAEAIAKHEKEYAEQKLQYKFDSLYPVPQEIIDIGYSVKDPSTKDLPFEESLTESLKDLIGGKDRFEDGYLWCIHHWGTKWDISEVRASEPSPDNDTMWYDFETAWSPPIEWLKKVASDFPDLTFSLTYVEEGMGFAGGVYFEKGEATYEENYESSDDLKEYREFVKNTFGYDPLEQMYEGENEEEAQKEQEKFYKSVTMWVTNASCSEEKKKQMEQQLIEMGFEWNEDPELGTRLRIDWHKTPDETQKKILGIMSEWDVEIGPVDEEEK